MSFFSTSDGQEIKADGKYESGGGDLPPIPKGTQVLAGIDQAKWSEFEGDRFIDLRWNIVRPEEFANRKIFQKVRVNDASTNKKDRALRMLAAIDSNAGGKLVAAGCEPTDESLLSSLANRPMVLKLEVWEIEKDDNGIPVPPAERKKGNWVSQVGPHTKKASDAPVNPMAAKPAAPSPAAAAVVPDPVDDFADDVPF
jgi:hypothetical protein